MKKILSILVVFICIVFSSGCSSDVKKTNLNNYISIQFSGNNTKGYANVKFDKDKFLNDYEDKIKFKQGMEERYIFLYGYVHKSPADAITKYISLSLNKTHSLSNGEKVQVTWNIDDVKIKTYFEFNYTYSTKNFVVSGLNEIQYNVNRKLTTLHLI